MAAKLVLACVVSASLVVSSYGTGITVGSAAAGAVVGGAVGAAAPWVALGRVAYGPWGFGGFGGAGPAAPGAPAPGRSMPAPAANPMPQAQLPRQAEVQPTEPPAPVYKFNPEIGFTHYNAIHYYPVKVLEKTVEVPRFIEVPKVVEVPRYVEVPPAYPVPVARQRTSFEYQLNTDC